MSRVEDAGLNASAPPSSAGSTAGCVRFSPGKAKRARCINAWRWGGCRWRRSWLHCGRRRYREAGLPLIFRLHRFTEPFTRPMLDLEALGWRAWLAAASTMTRP